MLNRKKISAEEAVESVLNFVYDESGNEKCDLDKLYCEDDFIEGNEDINKNSLTDEVSNDTKSSSEEEIVEVPAEGRNTEKKN